jgi:hypothetical protein
MKREAAICGTAALLSLCGWAPSAQAGPPTHLPLGPVVEGLNHACGVAVDSQGNLYASSAGESKIKIFTPSDREHPVAEIVNTNEPCSLAVDSNGRLYVSEKAVGKVVRYTPTTYPFAGVPSYGVSEPIDESEEAQGIAVEPTDNRLYVAEGDRIAMFNAAGTPGINEEQFLSTFNATGGTYKLVFKGKETETPIKFDAENSEIQAALESLTTIGSENVSVTEGNFGKTDHRVTFQGALGGTNVEPLQANTSGLSGSLAIEIKVDGFNGHIGEGVLVDATGVAAYTSVVEKGIPPKEDRYVLASDASAKKIKVFSGPDVRQLKLRNEIGGVNQDGNPGTPDQTLGFGVAGASVTVDPGNGDSATQKCENPISGQACTAGHFFFYDASHEVVDEFEANGRYLDQFADPAFADAEPMAIAVERSGGPNDGTIYVTSGNGAGAKLLAFGPLTAPFRLLRKSLSLTRQTLRNIAVDRYGDRYVAVGKTIYAYAPDGEEIKIEGPSGEGGIVTKGNVKSLAVDSACNVLALDEGNGLPEDEKFVYFTPSSCPMTPGTNYSGPSTCAPSQSFPIGGNVNLFAVGVNAANDHVFVTNQNEVMELDSPKNGCQILNPAFGTGIGISGYREHIAIYGGNGNVYIGTGSTGPGRFWVLNPSGTEVLARITGAGSPNGPFGGSSGAIAVDQSSGHILAFENQRGVVEEFEPSGAFVAQFGSFTKEVQNPYGIAVDNSGGSNDGHVFVAFDDAAPNTFDLTAFDPLSYGPPPEALTHGATEVGSAEVTLNGSVNPNGFELEECRFEYITEAAYEADGEQFGAGAASQDCEHPDAAEVGSGADAVLVHAHVTGLNLEGPYRFRLVATNKYGTSRGQVLRFGPPQVIPLSAHPISYTEATLRATIDPSGLATRYHFEYGTNESYGQSTPVVELAAEAGSTEVKVPIMGLSEGTSYHFRLIAENEADTYEGSDQSFETLQRRPPEPCPNGEFHTGRSASLPDCRAYELVTPADTRGYTPSAPSPFDAGVGFNNWLVDPSGEGAGEQTSYAIEGTLPGYDGSGKYDVYHAARGDGSHPAAGWTNTLTGPTYTGVYGGDVAPQGIAADQAYAFFRISSPGSNEGSLSSGTYLRTPAGFEALGKGGGGEDPEATPRFVSPRGTHAIFSSKAHLEGNAPAVGIEAIYDRAAGIPSAHVVSLLPGEDTPGEDASYVGASEDGTVVAFRVAGALYVRRNNQETVEVAEAPNAFAGVSVDGSLVFFADVSDGTVPGTLFVCDVEAGSCAGPEAQAPTSIAPESVFVNVSADGSVVYFTSKSTLDIDGEGVAGQNNLYLWNGSAIRFVGLLDPEDFVKFGEQVIGIGRWTKVISAGFDIGRAFSPTRATPDGKVLVFQSHAKLTDYENEGLGEVYRYDSEAAPGKQIACVSCDPTGVPPDNTATLQSFFVTDKRTLIPNVSDDGREVFFESDEPLLPEDANGTRDVYEWMAPGAGCERAGGCLALISSGQGERPSYLYGMSADGHDVFFITNEKLVGADVAGSPSIYDARVDGGIPEPPTPIPCQGDACQPQGTMSPVLPAPATTGPDDGNVASRKPCRKATHRVKGRCVPKHRKSHKHNRHHRRGRHRRAGN